MESDSKIMIFLLAIILAILIFFGINLLNANKSNLTGQSINEETEKIEMKNLEPEINEENSIDEEVPIEETGEIIAERGYETFEIGRFDSSSSQALIFYEINSEDIRCPISEPGTIIFFDETKTYLGYEELKEFLIENKIKQLLAFGEDDIESLKIMKKETGVSMMVKFSESTRENTDESDKPLYC